jgi:hypothetical protein
VLRQPGREVGGAAEVEQGVSQRLQPLQRQRLDAGGGGLAEGAAAAGEQAEGHLHFAASFPTGLPFLPAFLPAFLDQLLGSPGVTQLLGGNLDVHHHLLQGEVGVPLHQHRENRLSQIRTALQDLLAAPLQLRLMQHRQPEQIQQRIELVLLAKLFEADPDHLIQHQLELPR